MLLFVPEVFGKGSQKKYILSSVFLPSNVTDVPTIVFRTWELLSKAVADAAKLPSDEASDSSSEKSKKKPKESGKKTKSVSEIVFFGGL